MRNREVLKAGETVWEELRKEGKWIRLKRQSNSSKKSTLTRKRLQYFIESGLLEQMCAGGKGIPFKAVAQFFSNYGAFIGMRAKYNNRFVKHMTYI